MTPKSFKVVAVGCIAGSIAIAAGIRSIQLTHRSVDREKFAPLIAALGPVRLGEGRVSGTRYGSVVAVRGPNSPLAVTPELKLALAQLERSVGESRSAAALHALGIVYAVDGRLDDAISTLNESVTVDGANRVGWTDLAAAYLARNRPDDLSGASDAARRALALDPRDSAARFNLALALERLHLDREATAEWERQIREESESGWMTEAKAHLDRTSSIGGDEGDWKKEESVLRGALERGDRAAVTNTVRRFPQQSRELIADSLLPEWAHSTSVRPDGARLLAECVAESGGDRLMVDAIKVLIKTSSPQLQSLGRAHIAFAQGRAASGNYRYTEADALLAEAERSFEGRSPMVHWARMLRAIVVYQRNQLAQAGAMLQSVRAAIQDQPYPALLGQIDWSLGVIYAGQGDFNNAFDRYRSALNSFERIGEAENIAAVQSLLAETTRLLGDPRGSWSIQVQALSHLRDLRRPQRKQLVVMMAGQAALRQDRAAAALDFQNRFLAAAQETGSQTAIAEALLHRARVYRKLQDPSRARADLVTAETALTSATEAGYAAFIRAQIHLEHAMNADVAHAAPDDLLSGLSEALSYFRDSERTAWLPRVYLARARVLRQRGKNADAERDLLTGIETLEAQRSTVSSETLRVSYLDETWDLFDEMIGLQIDLGRYREAFGFAERSRARSLLDAAGAPSLTVDPLTVAAAVPANVVLVYYLFVRDRAVAWVFTGGTQRWLTLDGTPAEIERNVRTFRREIEAGRVAAATPIAAELYRELIAPVEPWLPKSATMVISPDRALHQLPFGALRKSTSEPYLIAVHPLVIAPSIRMFFRPKPSASDDDDATDALVIGNPSVDPQLSLPGLPGAEQEAFEVAALYPGARRLVREQATRQRFVDLAPAASVVHIAAHAVTNAEFPDLSRLFLAPDGGTSGALSAADLHNMKLSRTKLVVLAACGSAAGATFRGEGVISLARPFLANGVPQVVGTLWQVDDQTSRKLFSEFHRRYANGLPAARALQQAQLSVMDEPGAAFNWAAAVLIGSADSLVRHGAHHEVQR